MKHLLVGTVAAALLGTLPAQAQLAEPNEAGVVFGHVHLYVEDVDLPRRAARCRPGAPPWTISA